MDPTARPTLRASVDYRVLDDLSGVVVDADNGQAHALNPVGVAVIERCDGTLTVDEIVAEVSDVFDAPRDRIEQDVRQFLDDIGARGMIAW